MISNLNGSGSPKKSGIYRFAVFTGSGSVQLPDFTVESTVKNAAEVIFKTVKIVYK